jgi:hypothetical protein
LACHEDVFTVSEPWILLPYLYTLRNEGTYAEYDHRGVVAGVEDFCAELPYGRQDYLKEIRTFVCRLYAKAAKSNARYFLDKTPRYHLIAEDIINLFPDGKFIFLWRNPLSVVASMIKSLGKSNRWTLYGSKVDLFDGIGNLVKAYQNHGTRACSVRYEDLLLHRQREIERLFIYLELSLDSKILPDYNSVHLKGRWGDSTGPKQYQAINKEPLHKWKRIIVNPIRKAWCRHYLQWIGRGRLKMMGYELDTLLDELENNSSGIQYVVSDAVRAVYGVVDSALELGILKRKLQYLPSWYRIHRHR